MKRTPIEEGNRVFIRTVTNYYTGRILSISDTEIVLASAAWVASTGRFHKAMKSGELGEVETYPENVMVSVSRGAIVDVSDWIHPLPRETK